MMDFIIIPLVTGIVFASIYGLFELIIRRKERLAIIEKIGDKLDDSALEGKLMLPGYGTPKFSFSALKVGCLMTGIGLGLLIGFFINTSLLMNSDLYSSDWFRHNISPVAYGAPVLFFGGVGLLIAFIIELKLSRDK